jgi:hypothetical protein
MQQPYNSKNKVVMVKVNCQPMLAGPSTNCPVT